MGQPIVRRLSFARESHSLTPEQKIGEIYHALGQLQQQIIDVQGQTDDIQSTVGTDFDAMVFYDVRAHIAQAADEVRQHSMMMAVF